MSSPGNATVWLGQLRAGDAAAAQRLWANYFQRLVALARAKLRHRPRAMADEEDTALSAFDSFCRGAGQGRFPQLADRDDLWRLLPVITERKAIDQVQGERREKRGAGKVRYANALEPDSSAPPPSDRVAGREPKPDLEAQVADECGRLFDALADETLRAAAVATMEGKTNQKIGVRLGCSVPTVERKLRRIRLIWEKEVAR
jgi:DNA-directed RNA polymerase specialized sigma24 family protein